MNKLQSTVLAIVVSTLVATCLIIIGEHHLAQLKEDRTTLTTPLSPTD